MENTDKILDEWLDRISYLLKNHGFCTGNIDARGLLTKGYFSVLMSEKIGVNKKRFLISGRISGIGAHEKYGEDGNLDDFIVELFVDFPVAPFGGHRLEKILFSENHNTKLYAFNPPLDHGEWGLAGQVHFSI